MSSYYDLDHEQQQQVDNDNSDFYPCVNLSNTPMLEFNSALEQTLKLAHRDTMTDVYNRLYSEDFINKVAEKVSKRIANDITEAMLLRKDS